MSSLRSRVEKLEGRATPGTVLVVITERGEGIPAALERTARAWRRPVETFPVKIVLNFHGEAVAVP